MKRVNLLNHFGAKYSEELGFDIPKGLGPNGLNCPELFGEEEVKQVDACFSLIKRLHWVRKRGGVIVNDNSKYVNSYSLKSRFEQCLQSDVIIFKSMGITYPKNYPVYVCNGAAIAAMIKAENLYAKLEKDSRSLNCQFKINNDGLKYLELCGYMARA